MYESEEKKEYEPLPRFTGEKLQDWIANAIALFGPKLAAIRFLNVFPEFTDEKYGPRPHILEKVNNRFL